MRATLVLAGCLLLAGCREDVTRPGGDRVAALELSPVRVELAVDELTRFDVVARNRQGHSLPLERIAWTSGNEAVVTVDSLGIVRAVGLGTTVVRAEMAGVTGASEVVVRPPPVPVWREHTCAVTTDLGALCWGQGRSGQLGRGDREPSFIPVPPGGDPSRRWSMVVTGAGHSCGLATDGRLFCWGRGVEGQVGDGDTSAELLPVEVFGDRTYTTVTAGGRHACGISADGAARCWGWNAYGQVGNATTVGVAAPVLVEGGRAFDLLSAGATHTCGLDLAGRAFCWGNNEDGQLGNGTTTDRRRPVRVAAGGTRFVDISAGVRHTCAVDTEAVVHCWGSNDQAQLGTGSFEPSTVPVVVPTIVRFESVTVGTVHTCGVAEGGLAYCWGANPHGQLGNGTRRLFGNPTLVQAPPFRGLVAGNGHTCGIGRDLVGRCWGLGPGGQLGTGLPETSLVPVPLAGDPGLVRVDG